MADDRVIEEIVTQFLIKTCQLRPQLTPAAVEATVYCVNAATQHDPVDAEAVYIPQTTGSVAEFYIEPMLPHIGDVDVMYYRNNIVAIPQGYPPPTQLPDEFQNHVKVVEIIDSHLPGYVYLELRYLLSKCVDDGRYNVIEYDRWMYATNLLSEHATNNHGPALLTEQSGTFLSVDTVRCTHCPSWPPQASRWATRHRKYGWPYSATVDRVVINGCDVVGVAHRQCKRDEWMSKHQHRLSFSRAEIVLINSWIPVQQIVYHMLRVFLKTERLTESADNSEAGRLSNYHIKTLMLWACELKPRNWWTDDLSLVRICVELLHEVADWLSEARCPHYFIND